jgi:hypothetical protein
VILSVWVHETLPLAVLMLVLALWGANKKAGKIKVSIFGPG